MFNITFSSSNNAQDAIAKFKTCQKGFNTLYCRKENASELLYFLDDIRNMPEKDYQEIMTDLNEIYKKG